MIASISKHTLTTGITKHFIEARMLLNHKLSADTSNSDFTNYEIPIQLGILKRDTRTVYVVNKERAIGYDSNNSEDVIGSIRRASSKSGCLKDHILS